MPDSSLLNAAQTAGILFLCAILAYVVWRLERVMSLVTTALHDLSQARGELIRFEADFDELMTLIDQRMSLVESLPHTQKTE